MVEERPEVEEKHAEEEHKEQEAPKPPVQQRARHFAATHPLAILIGAISVIVLIIGSVFLMRYLDSYESTDDAEVDGHLNSVSSRVAGTVVGVYVEDNQWVKAGDLLVDLDPRDFKVAVEQAGAGYAQAQAQLSAEHPNVPIVQTTNQTNTSTARSDVAQAQASVAAAQQDYAAKLAAIREAQANNAKAQSDVLRYQLLVSKEEISHQQFDAVVAAAKTEAATVEAAQASAEAARKMVDQRREQLEAAETRLNETNQNAPRTLAIRQADVAARRAGVQSAKSQVDQASLNLSYTKIYASVSGIVTQKSVEVGQRAQPGEQLLEISQLDDIWITANFKETQLRRMQPGESVDIRVDAFGVTYHGYLESLPGATGAVTSLLPPENATGNFVKVVQRLPVRIRLKPGEDSQHRLRPGMSVEPKVWLDTGH